MLVVPHLFLNIKSVHVIPPGRKVSLRLDEAASSRHRLVGDMSRRAKRSRSIAPQTLKVLKTFRFSE